MVIDIKFLHACKLPTVAVLYQDTKEARHFKTYQVLVKDKVRRRRRPRSRPRALNPDLEPALEPPLGAARGRTREPWGRGPCPEWCKALYQRPRGVACGPQRREACVRRRCPGANGVGVQP